jgi:uncharacterized membrane protein YdfJ with MMPL/SSD domain
VAPGRPSLARLAGRRPGLLLAAAVGITVAALLPASRLRLEADLPSLLPDRAPAAAAYRDFL